jgi:hypothetical protein
VQDCDIQSLGYGIALSGSMTDIQIADNSVNGAQGGIIMLPGASGVRITVRDNDIRNTLWNAAMPVQYMLGVELAQATDSEIRRNRIHDLTAGGMTSGLVECIVTSDCPSVTVADNTVLALTAPNGPPAMFGIVAIGLAGRLDVCGNTIRSGTEPLTPGVPFYIRALSLSLVSSSSALPSAFNRFERVRSDRWSAELAGVQVQVTSTGVFQLAPLPLPTMLSVIGNSIEADGRSTVVGAFTQGPLVFNGNHIRRVDTDPSLKQDPPTPVVILQHDSIVMTGNYIETAYTAASVSVPVDPAGKPNPLRAAISGNVTRGPIMIGGDRLPDPWFGLNTQLP